MSQADVYQMMAYSQIYQCPKLTLLYPHHPRLGNRSGAQTRHHMRGGEDMLEVASVDVGDRASVLGSLRGLVATSR